MSAETRAISIVPDPTPRPSSQPDLDHAALLIGPSQAIAALWAQMRRVAPHFRMMMFTGEADTGAEAAARVMHDLSPVASGQFCTLDAEQSEAIFGNGEAGLLSAPTHGTIFLRHVEKLSRAAQVALLRHFYVTAPRTLRVIAFTRNGLRPVLSAGGFTPELASALTAVRLRLPALRERSQDLPLLVEHFLQRHAANRGARLPALAPDFLAAVSRYEWPGNLGQLRAVLDRLLDTEADAPLTTDALMDALARCEPSQEPQAAAARLVSLDRVVQEHIRGVLLACNGNKLRAAQVLGISRSTLYRMLESPEATHEVALAS